MGSQERLWWLGQSGLSQVSSGLQPTPACQHTKIAVAATHIKILAASSVLWHAVPEAWREGD